MNRRVNLQAILLAAGALVLGAPALGWASSGHGAAGPSGGAGIGGAPPSSSGSSGRVQPGDQTVSASGNGITIATVESALLRRPLRFTGNAGRAAAGETVEIERRGRQTSWRWAPTTHGVVASNGSFSAVWPVNHIGRFLVRAVLRGGPSAHASSASPTVTITVYRPSIATIYGPGFWGQRTACGRVLRRSTLGVANRSLPCGTPVAIYYRGRTIVVPVIDRGPYAHDADWDLTSATARALGITGTVTLGAVSLPRR